MDVSGAYGVDARLRAPCVHPSAGLGQRRFVSDEVGVPDTERRFLARREVCEEQLAKGETGRSSEPLSCRLKRTHFSSAGHPGSPGRTRERFTLEWLCRESWRKTIRMDIGTCPERGNGECSSHKVASFQRTSFLSHLSHAILLSRRGLVPRSPVLCSDRP